ncbi:5-oxoprolinase subunit PxpB [Ramlibacter sp. 2FC]|uniref:5-oxoprolinase subunit PxpB n=1 Tax=Ramlibacter sp. 2FC TaxID=2502188 RepID=UPI0010F7F302|nr:5-oxoprolinase subunit PxpB [Ramlibacter sp. 2FC]
MIQAYAAAPRLLPLGDSAWTVEFGDRIDPGLNARVMNLADAVRAARGAEPAFATVLDLVPSFRSLTVHYDPLASDANALGQRLLALAGAVDERAHEGRRWRLPVCFDEEFAPDLAALAQAKGLPVQQVIDLLTQARFRVYMIGFMPGFPYMGGLPPQLAMPRLATPRKRVPAHSLAVAGEMCSVYPWDSPGGWNLLGRTPVPLFSLAQGEQPAWLAAGDQVRWYEVARGEYERLLAELAVGRIPREAFLDPQEAPCPA